MLQLVQQLHDFAETVNPQLAPGKSFVMLFTVKHLGHESGFITIKPNQTKVAAIHENHSATTKIELMKFIGSMNFNLKNIDKRHVNLKLLFDLRQDNDTISLE